MLVQNVKHYSPLYFLAALGPGGLAVSFFMYLMFLVPHKGTPMAAMEHWLPIVAQGGIASILILLVLSIVLGLAILHFTLLAWNFKQFRQFKHSDDINQLRSSNAAVTEMAMPLTVSMSINMGFILGSLFVPNLWQFIQPVFPIATLGFLSVGVWALTIYGRFLTNVVMAGKFNPDANTNFSQLLAPFTFSMVAVGLAAPGAMSHSTLVSGLSLTLAVMFGVLAAVTTVIWLINGFSQIVKNGLDLNGSPTLWILIPILTLLGITYVRYTMGTHHNFDAPLINSQFITVMGAILGLQLFVGLFGLKAMKRNGYFAEFVSGDKTNPATFGLVCPGVALVVFGFFFVNYALIGNAIIVKYSLAHFILLLPILVLQLKTTAVMVKLMGKTVFNLEKNMKTA
jgi:hypothetical protein